MHIAQSGKQEGYYVECPARISCTIQAEEDHMHFNSTQEANEYSELKIAKEFGGVFGSGVSQRESARMAELEEISKSNTPVIENVKENSDTSHDKGREKISGLRKDIEENRKELDRYTRLFRKAGSMGSQNANMFYEQMIEEKGKLDSNAAELKELLAIVPQTDKEKIFNAKEAIHNAHEKLIELSDMRKDAGTSFGMYDVNYHALEQINKQTNEQYDIIEAAEKDIVVIANSGRMKSLLNTENRPEYIASIDAKHFDGSTSGSTFTDPLVKNSSDVLEQAVRQRGNLDGDDRESLIAAGADPSSFLPPESGVRYLRVELEGTQALKDTSTLNDKDVLHVVAKGGNDGRPPSLSFSFDVSEQPKTQFGTVVIGPDLDENKKPIPNTEVLWTMHPGIPTRGIRSDTIRENKLDAGSKITVKKLRKRFGKDIQVNTRLV